MWNFLFEECDVYCLCGEGESREMIAVITLVAPLYGSIWSALEWKRPQRGNGFAVLAKVCILFYSYFTFDNCYRENS